MQIPAGIAPLKKTLLCNGSLTSLASYFLLAHANNNRHTCYVWLKKDTVKGQELKYTNAYTDKHSHLTMPHCSSSCMDTDKTCNKNRPKPRQYKPLEITILDIVKKARELTLHKGMHCAHYSIKRCGHMKLIKSFSLI